MSAAYGKGEHLKSALEKFCMLTDDLVYILLKHTPLPHLKKASNLVKALDRRSCKDNGFYQHIGLKILTHFCDEVFSIDIFCTILNLMMITYIISSLNFVKINTDENSFEIFYLCIFLINLI